MTWSIVARDASGALGIAVASRFFAVGAMCPRARAHIGALSTQALCNPLYAPAALDLMAESIDPRDIVAHLTAGDAGRDHRQLHMIDAQGRVAAHTGRACIDWCGHRAGSGYSVAGNMLIGSRVVEDTAAAYEANAQLPFAERLVIALAAGEAAGGDKRGKQAAALRIHGDDDYPRLDIRVDDHEDPVPELGRLLDLYDLYFGKPDPDALLPLTGELLEEVQTRLGRLGYESLDAWAGVENYEERIVKDCIDPIVLEKLREATP
jgi:uncharacterized Ntn-hydrolase superfamily protein